MISKSKKKERKKGNIFEQWKFKNNVNIVSLKFIVILFHSVPLIIQIDYLYIYYDKYMDTLNMRAISFK